MHNENLPEPSHTDPTGTVAPPCGIPDESRWDFPREDCLDGAIEAFTIARMTALEEGTEDTFFEDERVISTVRQALIESLERGLAETRDDRRKRTLSLRLKRVLACEGIPDDITADIVREHEISWLRYGFARRMIALEGASASYRPIIEYCLARAHFCIQGLLRNHDISWLAHLEPHGASGRAEDRR